MASGLAIVAYDYSAAGQYLERGRDAMLATLGDRPAFIRFTEELARA
jgi:hypothetical protein